MKRWLVLPITALFLAAGCSQAPTEQAQQNPFDEEFGGVTTASEAPGFGDAALVAAAVSDEVDPGDPAVAAIQAEATGHGSRPHLVALQVIWGQMHYDSTSTTPTIWDGKLSVTPGRIGVVRVIRFEPATDYLLPRTEPGVVAWASQTTVHNDGLLVLIGAPKPERPDSSGDSLTVDSLPPTPEVVVAFETGPLTIHFSLEQLMSLDTVITVDDHGNAVMFHGTLVEPGACPRGFLGGQWTSNEEGTGGEFKGRWISDNGHLNGYLMGRYGMNSAGRRVFFGKFIAENGSFEGRIRGVWHPSSDRPTSGAFKGVFYDPMGLPAGRLHGRWVSDAPGTGTFEGMWKTHCPQWDRGAKGWARWNDENFDECLLDSGGA
jgi:hypothetical protein